jgi:hypothetical protein
MFTFAKVDTTPAGVNFGTLRLKTNGFVKVSNSLLILTVARVGVSPVDIDFGIIRVNLNGFVKVSNSLLL